MMTKLKTVLTLLLAAVMLLSLCACGGDADADAAATPSPTPAVTPIPDNLCFTVRFDEVPYYTAPLSGVEYTVGTVNSGTELEYVATQGDYVQLKMSNGNYWIHSWYLEAKDPIVQRQKVVDFVKSRMQSSSFEVIDGNPIYTCMAGLLNCRSLPSTKGVILTQLEFGDEVKVIGKDGDFYLVYLEDGNAVYCSAEYLEEQATYVDLDGVVDLRVYMPGAEFDLKYASAGNVTGKELYPDIPLLEESTAEMLMEAYKIFREAGYTIKIYDAYRPQSAQDALNAAGHRDTDGLHQHGNAVDISLVNMYTGKELEMPTAIYTFDGSASRQASKEWTDNSRANVAYITDVMTSVGFKVTTANWWHFEDPAAAAKMDSELDWDSLTYVPISQYVESTEIINPQPGNGGEGQEDTAA